jgi:hypothetical protein
MSYRFVFHIYQDIGYLKTEDRWQSQISNCLGDRERIWGQISMRKFGKESLGYLSLDRLKIRKRFYLGSHKSQTEKLQNLYDRKNLQSEGLLHL